MLYFFRQCSTGDTSSSSANFYLNRNCICQLINTCATDGQLTLYLNRSKPTLVAQYTTRLRAGLSSLDMTCGALPFGRFPNNWTLGKTCSADVDCIDNKLPKCEKGKSCRCCSNMNALCSDDSDCYQFEKNSLCGCVREGNGVCGPYKDLNMVPVYYDETIGAYPPSIKVCNTFRFTFYCSASDDFFLVEIRRSLHLRLSKQY